MWFGSDLISNVYEKLTQCKSKTWSDLALQGRPFLELKCKMVDAGRSIGGQLHAVLIGRSSAY